MKAEFNKAMNALLLHVDKSIVDSIRKIGHEYADEVSRDEYNRGLFNGIEMVRKSLIKEQEEQ